MHHPQGHDQRLRAAERTISRGTDDDTPAGRGLEDLLPVCTDQTRGDVGDEPVDDGARIEE
jgi:hypothetical protein